MTHNNRAPAAAQNRRRLWSWRAATLVPLLVFGVGGCSELLEVNLPGEVDALDITSPELAETLALSAQADFECGLVDVLWWPGLWFDEFLNSSTSRPNALMELRAQLVDVYADPCSSGTGPIWVTMQLPRIQGENLRAIMDDFEDGDAAVDDANWLRARAYFYEAYGIQFLAEEFCAVTFSGGPLVTRAEAYAEAESRFTSAMGHLANVTADNAADAGHMMTAALIGRARSNLFQGDVAGVIADATGIPLDYEYFATYSLTPDRRRNKIVSRNTLGSGLMPHREFLNLTISAGGLLTQNREMDMDDPRVPIDYEGGGRALGGRGLVKYRLQLKYLNEDDGIPFATGREALLMLGEVDPTQTVGVINTLRSDPAGIYTNLDSSLWPLPEYVDGGAAANAAALEEEMRRELWMQGRQIGNKIRLGQTFEPVSEYGTPRGAGGCHSIPFLERASNDNLTSGQTGR